MARSDGVGRRVAHYRDLSGKSQQWLAEQVGVTQAYISLIENGRKPVVTIDLIARLAQALKVGQDLLTGRPYPPSNSSDLETYLVVPKVRAALVDAEETPVVPRPLPELELMTDQAMAARMNCDIPALGRYLPAVLAETRLLWFYKGNRDAGKLLVKAAVTGSLALKAAGYVDLGIRLAELADHVSAAHGDPVCIAAARFAVAQCALSTDGRPLSARIAAAGADELDRLTRTGKMAPSMLNAVFAWMGVLHLHAALSKSAMPGGDAQSHLAAAAAIAPRVVGDPWRMEFSPANVGVWSVGIALEEGNPDLAPALARRVDPNQLITPQRRSRLYLDTGRAAFVVGDHSAAVRHLLAADRAAPGDLRNRPTAVEIVGNLVRVQGTGSDELRDLAVRVGIDPS